MKLEANSSFSTVRCVDRLPSREASLASPKLPEESYGGSVDQNPLPKNNGTLCYKVLSGAATGAMVGVASSVLAATAFLTTISGTPLAPAGNALATTLYVGLGLGVTLGAGAGILGHLNPGYIDFS